MKVSASDVAREAGVSSATVSLVFRGKPGISPATRERVLEAAKRLGFEYRPRKAERVDNTLVLVVFGRQDQPLVETPFFAELSQGVMDAAVLHGYAGTQLFRFDGRADARAQLRELRAIKCAGIVLVATEAVATDVTLFERLGVPVVLLDSWFPSKDVDAVVIDNLRGAYDAVRYLAQRGHRNIGYLHCGVPVRNLLERQSGFVSAMRELAPRSEEPPLTVRVGSDLESVRADMLAFLDTDPELPTAFFADNDITAMGCIQAMRERGIRVPEDVSVVGFDDMLWDGAHSDELTTMAVPKRSMGELAVDRLDSVIKGETPGEVIRISVQTKIVERGTVRDLTA